MLILHIEDDSDFFDRIVRSPLENGGKNTVYHAISKAQAEKILREVAIDYIVLDLAIPLNSAEESPALEHGVAFVVELRKRYPGLPVLILTGQTSDEAAQELEDHESITHFWGGKKKNLVKIRKKSQLDKAIDLVLQASNELASLNDFEIKIDGTCTLDPIERRMIQLFGICENASGAIVSLISGGLSGSRVFRVDLLNNRGDCVLFALAKIDAALLIETELENFNLVKRLPLAAFPSLIDLYYAGCADKKGIFFQLANDYTSDYFSVLRESDTRAESALTTLKEYLSIWHNDKETRRVSIGEIRRQLLSEEKIPNIEPFLEGINWREFEDHVIKINVSTQHGDLHGANILISNDNSPIIIDYADIARYPSSLDPITLELSPYFHPSSSQHFQGSAELVDNWFNDAKYIEIVKNPNAASLLRKWATQNSFLEREKLAVVYSYCMRQLSYPDTDKDFAIQLIRSTLAFYN